MMEKICNNCSHFNLTQYKEMAYQGFGHCQHSSAGYFYSHYKSCDCGHFAKENNQEIEKRNTFFSNHTFGK